MNWLKYLLLTALIVMSMTSSLRADDDESEDESTDSDDGVDLEDMPKKPSHKINTRPVIGILSQQSKPEFEPNINTTTSYIAASYVKWIEAAGGQSVPILNTYSKSHVLKIMSRINGILLPGGNRDLFDSNYGRVAKIIFDEVKRYNDQGTYYPMWGTCLGFQAICVLAADPRDAEGNKQHIRKLVKAKKMMQPVTFTAKALKSRLLKKASWNLIQAMSTQNVSIHMHNLGIAPEQFQIYSGLRDTFDMLATGVGSNGVQFVSMVEGKRYPIWATQYHPEKNQFEWTRSVDFNHEPDAIRVSQFFANFFVNQARRNFHEFENFEEEEKHMMFNYQQVYSGGTTAFQQVYGFGNHSESLIH